MPAWLPSVGGYLGVCLTVLLALFAFEGSPVRRLLDAWIDKRVSFRFDREIEKYKHELSLEGDRARNELQKTMHDFSLYSSKRHEVYRDLFRLLLVADGAVGQLTGFRRVSDYTDYSREDIARLLTSFEATGTATEYVLSRWSTDQKAAITELRALERRVEVAEAHKAYGEAQNYFVMNSLYLSDSIADASNSVLKNLSSNLSHVDFPDDGSGMKQVELKQEATKLMGALKDLLRKDLWGSAGVAIGKSAG